MKQHVQTNINLVLGLSFKPGFRIRGLVSIWPDTDPQANKVRTSVKSLNCSIF